MQVSVTFIANLPYKLKKRRKWYLASCPILDIHSQGENENKAKSNLKEAIFLFLVSCFERGTLDETLKECGFESLNIEKRIKTPHKYEDLPKIRVNLPLTFDSTKRMSECHA